MRWLAWAAAIAVGLVGCSFVNDTKDHQSGGIGPPVPATEFCDDFAAAVCDAYATCCPMPVATREQCTGNFRTSCSSVFGPILTDSRAGYDPEVAAQVLAEARDYIATCDPTIGTWLFSREGALRVLTGTVPGGGKCTPSNLLDLAAYFSCIQRDQACIKSTTSDWYCTDLQPEGEPCHGDQDCRDGLWCNGGGTFTEGTCAQRLPNYADCTQKASCQSLVCDAPGDGGVGQCLPVSPDAFCSIDSFL